MNNAVREAYFVPETIKIDVLFRNMKKTRKHFAIIVDEHGGVNGIITMNDLLEQIVGDLEDDLSEIREEPDIEKRSDGQWKIKGSAPLSLVSEQLGVMLPERDYSTFGGMVFDMLGSIPEDGSTFEMQKFGMLIKITGIRDRRIKSALVTLMGNNNGKKHKS
jgi:putative hemolysin